MCEHAVFSTRLGNLVNTISVFEVQDRMAVPVENRCLLNGIYCMTACTCRGGFGIFSKGGFSKNFENIDDHFFKVKQVDFPSSPKALQGRCFRKIFYVVFRHFLENFDKKIALFLAHAPPLETF